VSRTHTHNGIAEGDTPLLRCATVAFAVLAVDLASKLMAQVMLGTARIQLPAGGFLRVVYNDGFARGPSLGALTLPATLLLAAALLYLLARVCAPLAALDRAAPLALGLVAGATMGNAADLLITGRGVVDFLGISTARGGIVFNLADVAAYAGVALLARTAWILARLAWAEARGTTRQLQEARYPRLHATAEAAWAAHKAARGPVLEVVKPLPVYVERASIDGDLPELMDLPAGRRPALPPVDAPRLTLLRGEADR